ncbi:MAG TPA: RNA polymerase sigma factor [Bryobacteraceae bacterium]|nr:RNA polymerase sigma factor [Bryobacteraceae bacterium]
MIGTVVTADIYLTIDAVWRIESARLIAGIARVVRDIGVAEELAQDALVAALEQWPRDGIPSNPGAWLMAAAKHRAIDHLRRNKRAEEKHQELGRGLESRQMEAAAEMEAGTDDVGDDLLRLIFVACHPVLTREARAALTLRLLGGLTTEEIARAFLAREPTIAQRIVRAKRTLSETRVPFEVPQRAEFAARLASVLDVIYLIFNEGYTATAGEDWMRPALCDEALRLARILAELVPDEPEAHGLAALLEIQSSRSHARVDSSGTPILLLDQNRALWDQLLIRRGLAALARAELTAGRLNAAMGPFVLQAEIAACHARAHAPEDTDWTRIAGLYERLARLTPSPVVELNRAVAVGMAEGPEAGLAVVEALIEEPLLRNYHLLPSVRGDLLLKAGRADEARAQFERAAALAGNEREREMLRRRAAQLSP